MYCRLFLVFAACQNLLNVPLFKNNGYSKSERLLLHEFFKLFFCRLKILINLAPLSWRTPLWISSLSSQLPDYPEIKNREDLVFPNFAPHSLKIWKPQTLVPILLDPVHLRHHHLHPIEDTLFYRYISLPLLHLNF